MENDRANQESGIRRTEESPRVVPEVPHLWLLSQEDRDRLTIMMRARAAERDARRARDKKK